jgi:hypothetical protein
VRGTGARGTYLRPDARVFHVLLQGGWITLSLLENALHDRVLHDAHNLQSYVSRSSPETVDFLLTSGSR